MLGRRMAVAAMVAVAGTGASAQQRTVQQDFDAATALDQKGDRAAALVAWEALEKRAARNPRTHAIVLVRKSAALVALGRYDEGVAAARRGLAGLPVQDATLRPDRYLAYLNLGLIAQDTLDYASAAQSFAQAEVMADSPVEKLSALLGLVRTQTFVDPAAAAAAITRMDAIAATAKLASDARAQVTSRRAGLALNRGDFTTAWKESGETVKLLGGLTERTDLRDASARSDAAVAALLAGKTEEARHYMALTGAGRLTRGTFDPAAQMQVPECGGEAGLKPADMAVVEFSIRDDGTVFAVRPVYAAGGGQVALEFARAALGWSWTPEQVKGLPPFFRYNVRVEMRCSTAFERPSVGDMLDGTLRRWLDDKGVAVAAAEGRADAAALPGQRTALAAVEAKGASSLAVLGAIQPLLDNSVLPREEKNALAGRGLAIADANGVPALARLSLDLAARSTAWSSGRRDRGFRRALSEMIAQPVYAQDPQARSAIRLLLADAEGRGGAERARAMLQQVAADAALPPRDALRIGALVRLASIEQNDGNAAAARAAFEKSGLTASQCALVDAPPRFLGAGGTYPQEAMKWGFEGWTQTQFDVAADGRVIKARAVLSYPPFVFTKAGVATIAGARYAKSYRPDGGLGCGAQTQRVRFLFGGA